MPGQDAELITAFVCTRNRGAQIIHAISSILANTYPRFELIVVDQSDDEETMQAVLPFLDDKRLRYLRSRSQGAGRARNLGLSEASGKIVVMTDDDCVVPPQWLSTMAEVFEANPSVAVAFCNVDPVPYDASTGFIPVYQRTGSFLVSSILDKCRARGIGAGIAVRCEIVIKLGGFDEMLGPGSVFPSCEDGDIAVRALLGGYAVYETDATSVLHSGFRTWEQGRILARRDWIAIGAAYSKPLKCGQWKFVIVPLYELFCFAIWPPIADVFHFRRARGLGRIGAFYQGFTQGWRVPVDPNTLLFIPSGNIKTHQDLSQAK